MTTLLTPTLLEYLSNTGYRYCLSKTTNAANAKADVAILLKPVKSRPALRQLPNGFDTYFNINQEPKQMARGVDDTLIMIEVTHTHLLHYFKFFKNNLKKELIG